MLLEADLLPSLPLVLLSLFLGLMLEQTSPKVPVARDDSVVPTDASFESIKETYKE